MPDRELRLIALQARNPLGFLAAIGTLEVAARFFPEARLSWAGTLNPRAVLAGPTLEELHAAVAQDQEDVAAGPILNWPQGAPIEDLKIRPEQLSEWARDIKGHVLDDPRQDWLSDLWCGLVSEFGLDNKGMSKPTHFHFAAGQQRFLVMVRLLALTAPERFDEAWFGPWRMDSPAPVLGFDNREDRSFALRALNPAGDKKLGVPGADWLAFRGLAMYPTAAFAGRLRTRACAPAWKESEFRWPVWRQPLSRDSARSLLGDPRLVDLANGVAKEGGIQLAQRSVSRVYAARIRRTDQGGYGSLGPERVVVEAKP